MFKLMGKKIIAILRKLFLLNWFYCVIKGLQYTYLNFPFSVKKSNFWVLFVWICFCVDHHAQPFLTHVVGALKNHLNMMVLLSTHNINSVLVEE